MWKFGGESGQDICSSDSMEVVPSRSHVDVRSEEFRDFTSHHSLSYGDETATDGEIFMISW